MKISLTLFNYRTNFMSNNNDIYLTEKWNSNLEIFQFKTSGSTGIPKKINAHRKHLEASAKRTLEFLNIKEGIILNCLSSTHVGGAMQVIRSLVSDLELQSIPPSSNPFENQSIDWDRIALLSLVPYQLELLFDNYKDKLKRCQNILLGGAPLSEQLRIKIKEHQLTNCYETYGMTETLSHIALKNTCTEASYKCLKGVSISQDNRDCAIIADKQLNIPHLITNDIIQLHSASEFTWKGRYDNVINSGGLKHISETLEDKINKKLINRRLFIYKCQDVMLGETVNIAVENKSIIYELTKKEYYKEILNQYEIPKTIIFLPEFKETKNQKILREKSIEKYTSITPISIT